MDVPASADSTPRPDVMIFLIDTLRADRLGAYGYPKPTSPLIDRLSRDARLYEQTYAAAAWTLPSVVSLMTSSYPCEHGVVSSGQRLPPDLIPLSTRLRAIGYYTLSLYTNPYAGSFSGLDQGFDRAIHVSRKAPVDGPTLDGALDEAPAGKPLFVYVHNVEPHVPYLAPPFEVALMGELSDQARIEVDAVASRYMALSNRGVPPPQEPAEAGAKRRSRFQVTMAGEPEKRIDPHAARAELEASVATLNTMTAAAGVLYDAEVVDADQHLGQCLRVMRERAMWDDTVFLLVADHGEELGDRQGWLHGQQVYEELVHVPMVVRAPGALSSGLASEVTSLLDVVPTLAERLGAPELAAGARGRSLLATEQLAPLPAIATRINEDRDYGPPHDVKGGTNVVVRRGPLKGIWNAEPRTFELYDLARDPGERDDLGESPQAPPIANGAATFLDDCLKARRAAVHGPPTSRKEEELEELRALGYVP